MKKIKKMKKIKDYGFGWSCAIVLGLFALVVGAFFFEGWIVMELWNWAVVGIFETPELTYGKTLGIMVLINLVLGVLRVAVRSS